MVPYRYQTRSAVSHASEYYARTWGIDLLSVQSLESGDIIRFSYRVLDAEKAKAISGTSEPSLIDPGAGVRLKVLDRGEVGALPQDGAPQVGKQYWLAFSNKDRTVKPGHRVNVVVGEFTAHGLVVQ